MFPELVGARRNTNERNIIAKIGTSAPLSTCISASSDFFLENINYSDSQTIHTESLLTHTDPFGESMIIFRDCYKIMIKMTPPWSCPDLVGASSSCRIFLPSLWITRINRVMTLRQRKKEHAERKTIGKIGTSAPLSTCISASSLSDFFKHFNDSNS